MKVHIRHAASSGQFEIVGEKHAGNGNDVLYGSKDSLSEAVEAAKQLFTALPSDQVTVTYTDADSAVVEAKFDSLIQTLRNTAVIPSMRVTNVSADLETNQLFVDIEVQPMPAVSSLRLPSMPPQEPDFMDYFTHQEDYPRHIAANPLPLNTVWDYVSNTFLNGFINYVEIVEAHLLNRYHQMSETIEANRLTTYREPAGSFNWVKPSENLTKQQVFDLFTQKNRMMHTPLGCLQDDVIVLSRCKDENDATVYVYFWFDKDVSDCSIGRFVTEDSEEIVRQKFNAWLKNLKYTSTPIPTHFFQGWISF